MTNALPLFDGSLSLQKPRLFQPIELDYGEEELAKVSTVAAGSRTKLDPSIQSFIQAIFNVESIKAAMLEMEIDLNKMPLGKLSKNQIKNAYAVLTELQALIAAEAPNKGKISEGALFHTQIGLFC